MFCHLASEPFYDIGGDDRLAPLVWRLGEELNRAGPQRTAALRRRRDSTLARHVRAEHHWSSVNASREMSGTKRTAPASRCTSPPPAPGPPGPPGPSPPRSRMTSSWDAR